MNEHKQHNPGKPDQPKRKEMTVANIISSDIPVVYYSDSVSSVLNLMMDEHIAQLPLIDNDKYIGLVTESQLLSIAATEATLGAQHVQWLQPAVPGTMHPFDAIKVISKFDLEILPVIDKDNIYLGALTKETIVDYIATHEAMNEAGGIIVLEVNANDYTLAEIARICESNDVIILNSSVYTNPETLKLEVTLKLNSNELQYVIATFERYEYTVLQTFGDTALNDDLSGRYDLLMNYINM